MRLKLSGPDYKDKDPVKSLADFKERVKAYESAYIPLGDYEEEHGMQYIKVDTYYYTLSAPFMVTNLETDDRRWQEAHALRARGFP